ncbi:MAG: ribokinase [Bacteroides sp.]|nr:ribokinase [Bacteroides sp.]
MYRENKIVVIGSTNTDMVIKVDHLPNPGETILGDHFIMNQGGKGANQAVAIARLGGDVTFICKVGNDMFGNKAIEMFRKEGIETTYAGIADQEPSGMALINVDKKGENTIVVASGANNALTPQDIENAKSVIVGGDILLMQLEIPIETVEFAAKMANKHGAKVILNPAPARSLSNDLLGNLYMIIPNETEAEIFSGVKVVDWESAKAAADIISEKGVEIVIITLGSRGALVKERENYYEVPASKVNALDTTAAGDTFCAAVCVAIAEGKTVLDAVKFANKSASVTVTRIGAQTSLPYRNEIDCL